MFNNILAQQNDPDLAKVVFLHSVTGKALTTTIYPVMLTRAKREA